MMKTFLGTDSQKFDRTFTCENDCREYLFNMKWRNGYQCKKCSCKEHGKGRTPQHLRCKNCGYDESPTIDTWFHNLKFPLLKAFNILFELSLNTSGVTCNYIAGRYSLNPKTAWKFMKKMQLAMGADLEENYDPEKPIAIHKMDGATISFRGKDLNGLQQVIIAYQILPDGQLALVPQFIDNQFLNSDSKEKSELLWGHYVKEGKNINIWNLKVNIIGTHHHSSAKYLKGFVAECIFRYNNRNQSETTWHNLMECFMRPGIRTGGFVGK